MRLEWQAMRETGDHTVSVRLAVEIEGQLRSDAIRAASYLDLARKTLDPAFWEDDSRPQNEAPQEMDDEPQGQDQGQDPGRLRT